MKDYNIFKESGKWFKGNLHCHSTNSDGKHTPSEVVEKYKGRGYNFLAFTDHNIYTNNSEFNCENFIIIPGVELNVEKVDPADKTERIYHVLGISRGTNIFNHGYKFEYHPWESLQTAQNLIQNLNAGNNLTVFCHPNWSRLEFEDFKDLKGYNALEIFNFGCDVVNRTGLSIDYWDSLLRRGKRIWGMATDDAHFAREMCGGWIMVKSDELSVKAITDSIIEGSFYSSNGPEIYEFKVTDGEVYVECSPATAIHFVAYERRGKSFWADNGGSISIARHKLRGDERYVRAECVDIQGKTAWSNPIFL
jgi:hypothetical protein